MTDLHNESPQQTEDLRIGLLQEVVYWLHQPEVQEDPGTLDLASRSGTLLQEMTLLTDMHVIAEARKSLRFERVTERRLQPLALSKAIPPQPTCQNRRKKKRRREWRQEEEPVIFIRSVSLAAPLPASEREEPLPFWTPAEWTPDSPTAAKLPSWATSLLLGTHLALKGARSPPPSSTPLPVPPPSSSSFPPSGPQPVFSSPVWSPLAPSSRPPLAPAAAFLLYACGPCSCLPSPSGVPLGSPLSAVFWRSVLLPVPTWFLCSFCLCSSSLCAIHVYSCPFRSACWCFPCVSLPGLPVGVSCSLSGPVLLPLPVPVLCVCSVPGLSMFLLLFFRSHVPGFVSSIISPEACPECVPLGGVLS